MLERLFYELIEEGFIYDTDENGLGMSYGEYAAINDEIENTLVNEMLNCDDLETAIETLESLLSCSDDVRLFCYLEEYDEMYCYINDDGSVQLYNVPARLKDFFEELKERYEDEHYQEEDEEDEDYSYSYSSEYAACYC
jgi:hypothetical protein